jgi:hypothetical protein
LVFTRIPPLRDACPNDQSILRKVPLQFLLLVTPDRATLALRCGTRGGVCGGAKNLRKTKSCGPL